MTECWKCVVRRKRRIPSFPQSLPSSVLIQSLSLSPSLSLSLSPSLSLSHSLSLSLSPPLSLSGIAGVLLRQRATELNHLCAATFPCQPPHPPRQHVLVALSLCCQPSHSLHSPPAS